MKDIDQGTELVIANVNGARTAIQLFQKLKEEILDKNDIVIIQNKPYIKRSGWRKIALAFNLNTEILKIEREQINDTFIVKVLARAIAPNGRYADEMGLCDSKEFEKGNLKFSYHNIESKAVTRAINRAISDLVGGGEISAEEILQGSDEIDESKQDIKTDTKTKINWKDLEDKIKDFFDVNGLKNEYSIDREHNIVIIYGAVPKNFNDLKNILKDFDYSWDLNEQKITFKFKEGQKNGK